ncbi:MAG: site-specific DNA-methyltransferase [Spirochaetaceae bacterium]|nr:site-specific DNA-methyltransferase [Spirochaetaceae bacterium]
MSHTAPIDAFVPDSLRDLADPSRDLPRLAKSRSTMAAIEAAVVEVPTRHRLLRGDARLAALSPGSVHLVVTSPPYWILKEYRRADGQLGWVEDYQEFLAELDQVWRMCHAALVPGGRLVCVVGDVCLARRRNRGKHTVVPLHASIQEHCREIGFDNLAPIIWSKIANAAYEVDRGAGGFLGKPYEPNAVIKNDIEYILMQRKGGGYRKPDLSARILSLLSETSFKRFFRQIWTDIPGESTRDHPAPYPVAMADRLIRMFSFVGDTVLDPFNGTATTQVAAAACGRNSIGIEVDPVYFEDGLDRLRRDTGGLLSTAHVSTGEVGAGSGLPASA